MADNTQIIAATVQVDTGNSNANVSQLNKNLAETKGALKDTGAAAASASKDVEDASGSFGKIKEQMAAIPGPLGEATEGVGKLNTSFKALLANPVVLVITAIIAVLALLYKAFTNTFEGGEKMEQVFAGIKAAGQALIDNITKIAGAIVKLFEFDFSGAIKDMKEVVTAATDAYSAMEKLTKEAQELHKEQLANDLDQAERQKRLAVLREQATDDTIPIAKRKAALLELQKDAQKNAEDDIALAKKVTENKIAQLTLEKDGAQKNQDEINKLKIEQINVETDNANEQRRIAKQITAANKQELAERKEAADKARAEAKAARQQQIDYYNKLSKIQQDTELAGITDTYQKEAKILENKIADDKRQNDLSFEDKKITKAQHDDIEKALNQQADAQRKTLTEKHNQEVAEKELAFQNQLNDLINKSKLDGLKDGLAKEKLQLQIDHDKAVNDAAKTYKDDAIKFQEIKEQLDKQLKEKQDAAEEKQRKEDEKKKLDEAKAKAKNTLNDPKATFKARQEALDAEVAQNQAAYDAKALTEKEYLDNKRQNVEEQKQLDKAELDSKLATLGAIGDALGSLSDLVGKQTAAGKAFAIASATIAAIESAVKSFNALADIPIVGPALGAVAAAAAIASGIANVKKIVAVQVPGQSSNGSGSVSGVTAPAVPSAPVAPTQATTTLSQSSIDSVGDATSGRTYVLSGDVANNADRDARLNRAARLGG